MGVISGGQVIEGAQPRQFTSAGAPTDGTAGTYAGSAPPGALLVDTTNGDVYQNTNTQASPTWTLLSDAGVLLPATAAGRAKMASSFFASEAGVDDKFDAGVIGEDRLAANQLTGRAVANVADDNVIGGIPVVHRIDITAGANADTDVVLTHKTRVIDAWVVLRGAGVASAVFTVKNGANAISNGISASGADKAVTRAGEIDDAQHEIAAAGTLRVTGSGGATQPDATVYVMCLRVA